MRRLRALVLCVSILSASRVTAESLGVGTGPSERKDFAACQRQVGEACDRLAWSAREQGDREAAVKFFGKACFSGKSSSCIDYAKLGMVQGDLKAATSGYEQACRHHIEAGCQALTFLKKGNDDCSLRNRDRCYGLGHAQLKAGRAEAARRSFAIGCDAGDGASCFWQAKTEFTAGQGVAALAHYARSCQLGIAAGCVVAADQAAAEGRTEQASKFLAQACDFGDGAKCRQIAAAKRSAGSPDALAFSRKGCLAGDAKACCDLGKDKASACANLDALTCFRLAEKTQASCGDADRQFREACEKGEALACQRTKKASGGAKSALVLCEQGFGEECRRIGEIDLKAGRRPEGLAHLRRACELKVKEACLRVAFIAGGTQDNALNAACEQGDGKACYFLGQTFKRAGRAEDGRRYERKACAFGYGLTCDQPVSTGLSH